MKKIFSLAVALAGVCLFTACEDDNDANPSLVKPSEGSFTIFAPSNSTSAFDLKDNKNIVITWNQPAYTNNNAPIGNYNGAGSTYDVYVSLAPTFTTPYDANKVKEDETYDGVFDCVKLTDPQINTVAKITTTSLNDAINTMNHFSDDPWDEKSAIPATKLYMQVVSKVVDGGNKVLASVKSNVIDFVVMPFFKAFGSGDPAYLWVPGAGNGWNHGVAPVLVSEKNDGIYTGWAYMSGNFKMTSEGAWSGTEYACEDFTTTSANFDVSAGGRSDISFTGEAGVYLVTVDTNEKSISAVAAPWCVSGSFNEWAALELDYDTDAHCLVGEFGSTGDFDIKFQYNGWAVELGTADGTLEKLVLKGGGNIAVSGSKVKLYVERPNDAKGYYCVVE